MGTWDNLLLILRRNRCRNIFRISIPRLPLKSKNFLKWKITERKTDIFQLNKEGTRLSDSRSVMVPLLIHAKIALHFFTGWCLQSWKLERSQTNNFLKNSISFLNRTWGCQFGTLLLTSILQFPCLFLWLVFTKEGKNLRVDAVPVSNAFGNFQNISFKDWNYINGICDFKLISLQTPEPFMFTNMFLPPLNSFLCESSFCSLVENHLISCDC